MAVQTIKIVAGNSAPPFQLTLERDGAVIDVTGCTVELIAARGNTVTNTGHQTCTLVTPTSGVVSYSPHATDFPTAGTYKADAKITYGDGTIEKLYDQLLIKARKALGT